MAGEVVGVLDLVVVVQSLAEHLQGGVTLAHDAHSEFLSFAEEHLDRHRNGRST